jgi:hypothetical protein
MAKPTPYRYLPSRVADLRKADARPPDRLCERTHITSQAPTWNGVGQNAGRANGAKQAEVFSRAVNHKGASR